MQAILQKQSNLPTRYNLFSPQPPVPIKIMRAPKQRKSEIKIIFQHPNLLYLSNKRVKTKQELSEQIQQKLLGLIKSRKKNCSQNKPKTRPATSDYSYSQYKSYNSLKEQTLRCKTSAGSCATNPRRRKVQFQAQSHAHTFEEDLGKSEILGTKKIDLQNRQKDKSLNRSTPQKTETNSEKTLNRRIFNYNNRTIKSSIKKTRIGTTKLF